jgi:hypothetical protein
MLPSAPLGGGLRSQFTSRQAFFCLAGILHSTVGARSCRGALLWDGDERCSEMTAGVLSCLLLEVTVKLLISA